eukprot:8347880-Alexandrium_andersonii.AAC.1
MCIRDRSQASGASGAPACKPCPWTPGGTTTASCGAQWGSCRARHWPSGRDCLLYTSPSPRD